VAYVRLSCRVAYVVQAFRLPVTVGGCGPVGSFSHFRTTGHHPVGKRHTHGASPARRLLQTGRAGHAVTPPARGPHCTVTAGDGPVTSQCAAACCVTQESPHRQSVLCVAPLRTGTMQRSRTRAGGRGGRAVSAVSCLRSRPAGAAPAAQRRSGPARRSSDRPDLPGRRRPPRLRAHPPPAPRATALARARRGPYARPPSHARTRAHT
jgi:hypothetical protein